MLSQFEEAIWHWRGPHACPREAGYDGDEFVSSVEAILEFGEIGRHVLLPDGAICAGDSGLAMPSAVLTHLK